MVGGTSVRQRLRKSFKAQMHGFWGVGGNPLKNGGPPDIWPYTPRLTKSGISTGFLRPSI